MMRWIGMLNKEQVGITMVELVIAVALTGIIAGAATTAIFRVITESNYSSNHMTVVRQVQNAGHWISHDVPMAQSVVTGNVSDGGFPVNLSWSEWESGDSYQVVYSLVDMPTGRKKIERQMVTFDVAGNVTANQTIIVAEHIVPGLAYTSCNFTDGTFIFTVTASVDSDSPSETRIYRIVNRVS